MEIVWNSIRPMIEKTLKNELRFKIIKKRGSCAFGKFQIEFEDLIGDLRKNHSNLSSIKNL
jgi:hypothetical protein